MSSLMVAPLTSTTSATTAADAPRESTTLMSHRPSSRPSAAAAAGPRGNNNPAKMSRQLQQPNVTLIEHKNARFLITDQPSSANMENFILTCRLHRVRILVRVCQSTYDKSALEAASIRVIDLEFDDGAPPPDSVIESWFQLIVGMWSEDPESCIAVHCRAGLGRAPALVAVALIELGLPCDKAIEMIRSQRRGAFNLRQINFLEGFRSRKRLRPKTLPDKCILL